MKMIRPRLCALMPTYVLSVVLAISFAAIVFNGPLGAYLDRGRRVQDKTLAHVYELYPRLRERERQMARTLSGGEAQMLALGRGLMSAPDLIAIDEPSLGLAPNLVESMLNTVRQLKDDGMTVLLVEQSLALIEGVVDRIYFLEEGVISEGPAAQAGEASP